jgi:drug/metabolite transporter (DMT)-like permease
MNRALGAVLLIIGVALLIFGYNASESFTSEFSEFFQGAPSNKAIWMVIAGALCTVIGLVSVLRRRAA